MRRFNRELISREVYRFLFHAIALALILLGPALLRPEAELPRRLVTDGDFSFRWQIASGITALLYLLNVYLFIPRFLKSGKYLSYVGLLLVTFMASTYLMTELFEFISGPPPVLPEGVRPRVFGHGLAHRLSVLPVAMSLALGTSFEMILNWEMQRKEKIQMEREKIAAELSFLKSQVNPHFLFNSLNCIYALSEQKSAKAGNAILLLSNLMRYMLYGTNNGKTEISKEVDCIEDYIQLQRLRISLRDSINIHLEIAGRDLKVFIEPLILIPFIENAFKHGVSYNQKSEVSIKLYITIDAVELQVRNTKKVFVGENPSSTDSGIGLANIKRRLDLLYPSRHSLMIHDDKDYFTVELKIQPLAN